jgi:hypothetical protein
MDGTFSIVQMLTFHGGSNGGSALRTANNLVDAALLK